MSRLEFRARVEQPRPASAWWMVGVASASLWITGQLPPFVIALQVAAIAVSLWRRDAPFAWQRHPIPLNFAMAGISAVAATVAWQGQPSTVALAHFAALAQGLQLLDARPRKSEFLLVALALFQVILAANLTDSLLFPVLLVVFVVSTTWTLLLHTLRSEAIEAGEGDALARAVTPGLLRTTLVASGCSIALAAVLFVMLPRMRTRVVEGGLGSGNAVAGFSDRVELGTIGRIRQDSAVVLRVETLKGQHPDPATAYWRGLAFDSFDGRDWSITPSHRSAAGGSPKFGVTVDAGRRIVREPVVQQIVREPVTAGVLFATGSPRRIAGPLYRIEMDVNGGLYAPREAEERIRYTIEAEGWVFAEAELADDRARIPAGAMPRPERFTRLPEFAPAIAALAREVTANAPSDSLRARSIEAHLRHHGQYTDSPPALGVSGRAPIEDFLLGELAGHCEYFASAMVVLTRSLGMPSRLVNGFAGGRLNPLGGFLELTRSDAHAWVEVYFEEAGWVRYDPTPPDLRLRADGPLSLAEHVAQLQSVIELWWFQRVVDFDTSDQIEALRSVWGAWRVVSDRATAPRTTHDETGPLEALRLGSSLPWRDLALAALAAALVARLVSGRTRRRRRPALPAAYARALRLLARRGLVRSASTPARSFVEQVRTRLGPGPGQAFDRLTEAYLAERFGGRPSATAPDALAELRRSLSHRAGYNAP